MLRQFYQKHRSKFAYFNAILLTNPVLERGLVLAPIVVASKSAVNALSLSVAFVIITFLTALFSLIMPLRIPYTVRVIFNALLASVIFIPTAMLVERLFPGSIYDLGIYLPMLVTNSLIVQKLESRFHKMRFFYMLLQLICNGIGFTLVALIVGCVREFLGKGTLFGRVIEWAPPPIPAILLPFFGFILLGFLAAAVKKYSRFLNSRPKPKKKGEQSGTHE